MFWYLVDIALKLLSVLNEQLSYLLEDVFVKNIVICIRLYSVQWISSLLPTRIPFWAGYVFPESPQAYTSLPFREKAASS